MQKDFLIHVSNFIKQQPTKKQLLAELYREASHYERREPSKGTNWRRKEANKMK